MAVGVDYFGFFDCFGEGWETGDGWDRVGYSKSETCIEGFIAFNRNPIDHIMLRRSNPVSDYCGQIIFVEQSLALLVCHYFDAADMGQKGVCNNTEAFFIH